MVISFVTNKNICGNVPMKIQFDRNFMANRLDVSDPMGKNQTQLKIAVFVGQALGVGAK